MMCPDCNIELPKTKYKVNGNSMYIYKEGEEPKGGAYPLILDIYTDWQNRRCYREVHKCYKCQKEMEMNVMEPNSVILDA